LAGVAGIERHAGLLAERLDALDGAVEVRAGLGMDGDDVGAGLGEGVEERVDRRIIRWTSNGLACAGEAPSPRRADRQVGHEMAVHDVDVDPVGAGLVDRAHFLAELAKSADRIEGAMSGHGPRLDGINRADKARHEEAVEPAFGFEQAGQDADPAFGRWGHEVGQARAGRIDAKSGVAARKAATTCSPSSGSSEQTE
jgi:hypothetical protein